MVPREAGRGQSFKGARAYYLHDKNASTSDRVAFTFTENVPTQDPDKALKWMAWTAIHAEELKRESGSKMTGRPCSKPVFTFSLSWHPEQEPKKWEMIRAGRRALIALGLQDHETVMVAHNDTDHSHLHLIVNVVDPETGKANRVAFSKKRLSAWAEEYEREHGKIYCDQRVENNAKRAQGKKVKYEEAELDLKARVTKLYQESGSGAAFQTALAKHGFTLARGKKLVLIDRDGNVHSLSRQIDGGKEKYVRARLGDLELPDLDTAKKRISRAVDEQKPEQKETEPNEPECPDRDQQNRDWQESIIDAGIEHADGKPKPTSRPQSGDNNLKRLFPEPQRHPTSPSQLNRIQDRQIAELGHFYTENTLARLKLVSKLDQQYGGHERELRQDIARLENTLNSSSRLRVWWLKITKQLSESAQQDLKHLKLSLENIEWRKAEAERAQRNHEEQRRFAIEQRHRHERLELSPQESADDQLKHAYDDEREMEDFGPSLDY